MTFNEAQLKLIEEMADWKPPAELCFRCVGMGVCHLLRNLLQGTPMQQNDLLEPSALRFAADCKLNDMSDEHLDIFDMLEKLHTLGSE